ncbi:unnamed protein product [Symbiodinium sp. CCMP2592]|nr:unnamed protein product [Symbiodinium sp. CCMP2592]
MAMSSESIESYLKSVIQPLTTDLATDMLPLTPQDPESFITGWLRQRAPHHQAPMSLRRRNEALKQELSALEGELSAASHGGGSTKDLLDSHGGARAEDCGGNGMQDFDLSFAMTGLPQMQAPFKRGRLWQYQPRTDTWEKVLVLLGPGVLETFAETTGKRQARLMLGATGSAKPEHEKLPPEIEGYAFEVSNFVQAEPALTHLRLAAATEEERREWLLAINGHVTALFCKMGAALAVLSAELQRLKSEDAGTPAAKREGGEDMAQLERRLSRLEQRVQPEDAQEPRKPKREDEEEVDPATMPTTYDAALELSGGATRLHDYEAFSGELKEKYEPNKDLVKMMGKDWQKRRSFSTKMNYQPYKNTLEELYAFCKEKAPIFFAKVREVAERTGGRNVEPPLKGMPRCRDKAQFKYKDKNGDISWHRLTDIVRDTIVYKNLDDMYKGLRAIHEDEEIDIIECNDRYMNPLDGGYRDLQLSLRIDGMVCELQLNTKWMLHVKENAGHRAFEVSREVMAAVAEPNAVERCHNILRWGKENLGPNADAELQEMLNDDKKGLLHKAAKAGNAQLVSIFLAFRADVNHRDPKMMRTPLHEAMAQGHERAMWALLCARADLQARDNDGQVPLLDGLLKLRQSGGGNRASTLHGGVARLVSVAVQCGDAGLDQLRKAKDDLGAAVKRRLVQSQVFEKEVMSATEKKHKREARPAKCFFCSSKAFLFQFELVSSSESFDFRADGNLAKVKQLLAEWADPNTPSSAKDGHPPLHAVLLRPQGLQPVHFEILRALVDMDADLGLTTEMAAGETPCTFALLHSALHSKSGKALKMLAAAGLRHEGKPLSQVLDPDELRSEEPSVWSMLAPLEEQRVQLLDASLVSVGEMLELGATPGQVKGLHKRAGLQTPEKFLRQVVLKGFGPKDLAEKLREDPRFLAPALPMPPFEAVREALQQAPADLLNDQDVLLACIGHDAACLADAPEALRSDRSLLLEAVQRHPRALEFAAGFREDRDFVADAMRLQPVLEFAGGLRRDRELALEVVRQAPWALDLVDAQLQNDVALAFQATQALAGLGTRDVDFSQMAELRSVPHDSRVCCICDTGASRLAVGCSDGTIQLHNLGQSDEPASKLVGHERAVRCLCLMSVEVLASGSADSTVRTWNLHSKEALKVLSGHTNSVEGLARLNDTRLASASADKTVRLWSLAEPEECRVLQGHSSSVLCLCLTNTGSLVSGSFDKTLRVWSPETGEEQHELRGHEHVVLRLCQASAELLASGSYDQTVRLWSLSGQCLLAAHTKEIGALVMAKVQGEHVLCSGSVDSTLKLWQLQAWGVRGFSKDPTEVQCATHDSQVCCACDTGASRLAVGCEDGTIKLHDLSGTREPPVEQGYSYRHAVHWRSLLTPATRNVHRTKLVGHEKAVTCLCLMSDDVLASGSEDKTVRLWNLHSKEALQVLSGHTNDVQGLARLNDTQLASASKDKTVRLWSLAKPEECRVLQGHTDWVRCVCLTTTGSLVSGSEDRTLRVWNPETGEEQHELLSHQGSVFCLCQASPELLASGSIDQTVRLWSLSMDSGAGPRRPHFLRLLAVPPGAQPPRSCRWRWPTPRLVGAERRAAARYQAGPQQSDPSTGDGEGAWRADSVQRQL